MNRGVRVLFGDPVGLCRHCAHAREVGTSRSVFWLCQRAATDARFERYPRLPVISCPGFEPGEPRSEPGTVPDPEG